MISSKKSTNYSSRVSKHTVDYPVALIAVTIAFDPKRLQVYATVVDGGTQGIDDLLPSSVRRQVYIRRHQQSTQ